MFYKKNLFLIFFLLFSRVNGVKASTRDLPEQFYTPKTAFLDKILSFRDLKTKIFLSKSNYIIPAEGTIFSDNGQELLKTNDSLFVLIERTGVVYFLEQVVDTSKNYIFHRLDHTININYNIDANNFLYKNHLYSYGGYGFWRLNGHLRGYNFLDKEWDIVPLNKEIISNGFNWFDKKEGKLYVPFQSLMNASIKGNMAVSNLSAYDSYYLDMNLMEWVKTGSLSTKTQKLIIENDVNNSFLITDQGFIFLLREDIYYFNFFKNKIYKSKNSELNQFLMRRISNQNIFFYKDAFYNYIPDNQKFDIKQLALSDFDEMDFPIWGFDKNYYYYGATLLLLVVIIVSFVWFYNRTVRKKVQQSNLKILKSKTIGQTFIGVELALIQLLLKAFEKGESVEINQINHVLGIKDKNIGLQKKVRSDVINTINEKYMIVMNDEVQLISSVRKSEDKRFYEYFVNESEIKSIKKILERK
jgi:hypothetical protein